VVDNPVRRCCHDEVSKRLASELCRQGTHGEGRPSITEGDAGVRRHCYTWEHDVHLLARRALAASDVRRCDIPRAVLGARECRRAPTAAIDGKSRSKLGILERFNDDIGEVAAGGIIGRACRAMHGDRLRRAGSPIRIYEKPESCGGTWRKYVPRLTCDCLAFLPVTFRRSRTRATCFSPARRFATTSMRLLKTSVFWKYQGLAPKSR